MQLATGTHGTPCCGGFIVACPKCPYFEVGLLRPEGILLELAGDWFRIIVDKAMIDDVRQAGESVIPASAFRPPAG